MKVNAEVNGRCMTDKAIIEEAARQVADGMSVTFPVKGYSMLPFIIGGKDSVILERPESLQVNDVVLAWVDGSHYVVHRIIQINGDHITLMGDGNLRGTERCHVADVKARASHVVGAGGRRHMLRSAASLRTARLWRRLLPVRRWLLAIYRRLNRNKFK